jgi:hypothetical protein
MAMPPLAKDALIKDPTASTARSRRAGAADRVGADRHPPHRRRRRRQRDRPRVRRGEDHPHRPLPKGVKLFFHGDPARSSDGFGLGFAHGAPATIEVLVPAGEVMTARQMARAGVATRHDRALGARRHPHRRRRADRLAPRPARNRHVDQLNVREVLQQLVEHYRIGGGSFDHYDSAELVQWLEAKKLPVENEQWSNPFQHRIYRGARAAFYNDLVTLPDTPSITARIRGRPGAIYELLRVEEIEGHKIDHPEGGSKDLADVVARLIEHVTGAPRRASRSAHPPRGRRKRRPSARPGPWWRAPAP